MKRIGKILILNFFWMIFYAFALDAKAQIPQEEIFVHLNTNYLLSGETLHYTIYCLDEQTRQTSNLSQYVYVELVGENGTLLKRKMRLEGGVTSGSFFIPTSLETGQYYLMVYTLWMRNFESVSETPLVLINPYKPSDLIKTKAIDSLIVQVASITGEYVAEENNVLVFRTSDAQGKGQALSGRLVDSSGQEVLSVQTDNQGIGRVKFRPAVGEKYKLIFNQSGKLHFFDLPSGISYQDYILIDGDNEYVQLRAKVEGGGMLEVTSGGLVVFSEKIESRVKTISIERKDLPENLLRVVLKDSEAKVLKTYNVFNQRRSEQMVDRSFSTREEVTLPIALPAGNYSLSIRKRYSLTKNRKNAITNHVKLVKGVEISDNLGYQGFENISTLFQYEKVGNNLRQFEYLPESRSEILAGKVISSEVTKFNEEPIILSLPSTGYNLSANKISEDGSFLIEYNSVKGGSLNAYLTVYDFKSKYGIEYIDNFMNEFPDLSYEFPDIDSMALIEVKERSISSQLREAYIQNGGYASTIEPPAYPVIKASSFNYNYEFDNYTRFKTLKDHFLEYIVLAKVRENDLQPFKLLPIHLELNFDRAPLITLDGVPVNGRDMLNYSPYKIKTLNVLNSTFYLQHFIADGVLDFRTFDGDLKEFPSLKNTNKFVLEGAFSSDVSTVKASYIKEEAIPDQRVQLLWWPRFKVVKTEEIQISFTTSDLQGLHELVIEGWTDDGRPITVVKLFNVKNVENERE